MSLPTVNPETVEIVLEEFESCDDLRTYLIDIGKRIRKHNPLLMVTFPDFAKFLLSPSVRNFDDEPIRSVLMLYRLLERQAESNDLDADIQEAVRRVKRNR